MIVKIYFIGLTLTMIWFLWLAKSVFNEDEYEKNNVEGKKAIDELYDSLISQNPDNPQNAYAIYSLIACVFWPIVIPIIIYKSYK